MLFIKLVSQLFKKISSTTSSREAAGIIDLHSKQCPASYCRPCHDGDLNTTITTDMDPSKVRSSTMCGSTYEESSVCPFNEETHFCCESKARREIGHLCQRLKCVPNEDDQQRSVLYNQLGNAYCALKAFDTSKEFFYKSLRIARSMHDSVAEAYACGRLADVLRKQHSFREGIYHAARHVSLAEKNLDEDCKSYGYFTLASQYYFRAKYHLLESDSFEEDKDLDHRLGTLKMDLGLSTIIEDLENAVKFYTMCSEGFSKLGHERKLATTFYYIADAYFLLGDCKKALQYLLKAMKIGEQFDDNHLKQLIYSKLSSTYVLLSECQLASKFSREAVKARIRIKEENTCSCAEKDCGLSHEKLHEVWTSAKRTADNRYAIT
ncbi:tetratricopeptide repeat protein [Ostertagia ostertagi]